MKRTLIAIAAVIILLLSLNACKEAPAPEEQSQAVIVQVDDPPLETPPPVVIPEEPEPYPEPIDDDDFAIVTNLPETAPIILSIATESGLFVYDSNSITQINAGQAVHVSGRTYAIGNAIRNFSETGDILSETFQDSTPDTATVNNKDLWTCTMIDPQQALDAGGLYRYYSEFRLNGISTGHWSLNQYQCADIIATSDGSVIVKTETGLHISLAGAQQNILVAIQDGLMISDYDATTRTANFNGVPVSWATNYMSNAKHWQESAGVWYSGNGYEYDGTLYEDATAMWQLNEFPYPTGGNNGESPVIIPAGVDGSLIYWIDTNTGTLLCHDTLSDTLSIVATLYTGDGTRESGLTIAADINATLIGRELYFYHNGVINEFDLDTGFLRVFYSGFGEVFGW